MNDNTVSSRKLSTEDVSALSSDIPKFTFNLFNNRLVTLNTLEDYFHPFKRGILIKVPDENKGYISYHYDFEQYQKIDLLRGNVPTIDDRFLELYLLKDFKTIKTLENYYRVSSKNIKKSLFDLYKIIFDLYVKTHKLHLLKIDETNKYFTTLKQIHALFFSKNNKKNTNLF